MMDEITELLCADEIQMSFREEFRLEKVVLLAGFFDHAERPNDALRRRGEEGKKERRRVSFEWTYAWTDGWMDRRMKKKKEKENGEEKVNAPAGGKGEEERGRVWLVA